MLHHVSVGVRDVARASVFYDAVMAALKYKRVKEMLPLGIAYGDKEQAFWISLPRGQQELTIANGASVTFVAKTHKAVTAFFEAALAAGATADAAPAESAELGEGSFVAAVIDPDGNRLEVVHFGPVKKKRKGAKSAAAKKAPAKKAAKAEKKAKPAKAPAKEKKTGKAKKSAAKKAPAKKAPAKKSAAKKSTAKKAVKKAPAKKAPAKKAPAKKTAAKKTAGKRTAIRRKTTSSKKPVAKRKSARKAKK